MTEPMSPEEVEIRAALLDLELGGDVISVTNGVMTKVHSPDQCGSRSGYCWIHNPSPYNPLREAPVAFVNGVALRLCAHWDPETGTGAHPDPDDADFRHRGATKYVGWIDRAGEALHTCCPGPNPCCRESEDNEADHE